MSQFTSLQRERFWSRVNVSEANQCWEWQGALTDKGYGRWGYSKTESIRAHRAAFLISKGPIPSDLNVLHACDNRRCCNPKHLSIGTQQQNLQEMRERGRGVNPPDPTGERNPAAKLTLQQVREIQASSETLKVQAERYGVAISTVHAARSGQNWSEK